MVHATFIEQALVTFTIGTAADPTTTDTTGDTVTVTLTAHNAASPSAITVGTAAGAAAGTNIAVSVDLTTSGISSGLWELEAVADKDGANPKTLIPNTTTGFPYLVRIKPLSTV